MKQTYRKHDIDPYTFRCKRCDIGAFEMEFAVIPISCISDERVEWTKRWVEYRLSQLCEAR
jgi:hypothetical protein